LTTLIEDILIALQNGARAGAAAASSRGRDLRQDVETFLVPHLEDIAAHAAPIIQKRAEGIYTDETAKELLASEADAVKVLLETIRVENLKCHLRGRSASGSAFAAHGGDRLWLEIEPAERLQCRHRLPDRGGFLNGVLAAAKTERKASGSRSHRKNSAAGDTLGISDSLDGDTGARHRYRLQGRSGPPRLQPVR